MGLLVFKLLCQAGLDKREHVGYLRIGLRDFGECFHIYLVLLCGIDVTEVGQSLEFVFYLLHRC